MENEQPTAGTPEAPQTRGQYSLRTLLLLPVVAGVLFSLLFASPSPVIALELIALGTVMPGVLLVMAIFGQGAMRAFSIGALFPVGSLFIVSLMLLLSQSDTSDPWLWFPGQGSIETMQRLFDVCCTLAIVTGLSCVGVRWALVSPRGWRQLLVVAILLLLILSGPIVDQIGQMRGWWGYEDSGTRPGRRYGGTGPL